MMKQIRSFFTLVPIQTLLIAVGLGVILSCHKRTIEEPKEKILVEIGDKNISVDEFIRRAEYTVRPPYCRGNHNLDKKIIINSLIAEKLMSIEAGDANEFISHDNIQAYLRGRREQAMRQWLYEEEARNKVALDTAQVLQSVQVAGRRYTISYFNLPDGGIVSHMANEVRKEGISFEELYPGKHGGHSVHPGKAMQRTNVLRLYEMLSGRS